jgi:hypothetical protein
MSSQTYFSNTDLLNQARVAFSKLTPIRDDYPFLPIEHGFNWDECASGIRIPPLFLVVFRSIRRTDADLEMLREFDDRAFADAQRDHGFLFYFKGQVTPERACLSFCLWATPQQARAASDRPDHVAAARLVRQMYESYELERHMLCQQHGMLVFERLTG